MTAPIPFTWDGEAMVPLARFAKLCDKQFVVGEDYPLAVIEERSGVSHKHYFARVHDLWLNLPDGIATQWSKSDDLRKHALIMTGWHKERRVALSSAAEARKIAAFLMARQDDYALISVAGNVVIERIARSQSMRQDGMRRQEFQKSKDDVLGWIEALIEEAHAPSIAPQSPSDTDTGLGGEERQAGEPGNPALSSSAGLPRGRAA